MSNPTVTNGDPSPQVLIDEPNLRLYHQPSDPAAVWPASGVLWAESPDGSVSVEQCADAARAFRDAALAKIEEIRGRQRVTQS